MLFRILPAFVLLAVIGFATSVMAAVEGENLITPLPTGFKIGSQSSKGPIAASEYVPNDETVDNWSRMITVQIFHNMPNFNPDTFGEKMAARWKAACAGGDARKINSGTENGYPISLWLFTCPMNPKTQKPENTWVKAIGGQDAFYNVQYAFRKELGEDLIAPAMQYLRLVGVCDARRPDRACPEGMQ